MTVPAPILSARADETAPLRHAVVIGGGIAGLATAALLARDGVSVDLLEQQFEVGGRVGSWEQDGFRFDTGASWYLMPEVFDRFFSLLGTSADEQLDLTVLDPGYRAYFEGHSAPLDLRPDQSANAAAFEQIEAGAGAALQEYLDSAHDAYTTALRHFLYTSYDRMARLLHPQMLSRLPRLARLLVQPLDQFIAQRFSDRRLRQILGYPAVFLGSSPDRTPSMYHLMSWLDLADGVRYPQGGFTALIDAISALAQREGVRVHTGATVTAIQTGPSTGRAGKAAVSGVRYRTTDGGTHVMSADLVVGAADLHHLETKLLGESLQSYPERWWLRRDPGPGAVLVLLGVTGTLPQLAHHTLFFTADWQSNFDAIFGRSRHVPDPASMYVCKPSETDPTVAPAGCENLFLLIPVPADPAVGHGGVDRAGDDVVERIAEAAIDQIQSWAGVPDLRERIVVRRTIGPADFVSDFNAWRGGALGPGHTLRQSAFLRARNVSGKVEGLYYAGSSTIPGIGLPMCLISAELALDRIRAARTSSPRAAS
jgi:1-hydroxy-2-isopentenylcarotenoid 3,4-desaturase